MSPAYFFYFKYLKSRQTGSGHAADSKLRYTIQFSTLMLCAKYQEAGLCGSREKCDRNYLVSKLAYVHNIQSRVKQEVELLQIQKFVTPYSSPYWCSVRNIRMLASVLSEKNETEIILWANLPMSTIFKVASNRKWTCRRFKNALHDTVVHTDALCQISGSWPVWFLIKMWQKFFVTPTPTTTQDFKRLMLHNIIT